MKFVKASTLGLLPIIVLITGTCAGPSNRVEQGRDMPNITVISLSGATGDLKSLRHNQAALINFWATWCEPCRREAPLINRIAEEYGSRKFSVISIAMGEPLNVVKAGAAYLGIKDPIVVAPDLSFLAGIGIEKIPTLVLLDAEGRVLMVENGLTESLTERIKQLNSSSVTGRQVASPFLFSGGLAGIWTWPSFWVWPIGLLLCALLYYSLIIIHSCAHNTFTRSKMLNKWIGEILSFINLFRFADFRALHHLHHARTNQPGKDPHYVYPAESRLRYDLTQYFQLFRFTYSDFYRHTMWPQYWKDVDTKGSGCRRSDLLGKILFISGRQPYGIKSILWNNGVVLVLVVFAAAWLIGGPTALIYPLALWLVPWEISQILIADFNYRGHVGLLAKGTRYPYRGEDTRNLDYGLGHFVNLATFGFFRHQDHHKWPNRGWGQ